MWWNDDAKAAVRRKEVLGVGEDEAKEREILKVVYIRAKRR